MRRTVTAIAVAILAIGAAAPAKVQAVECTEAVEWTDHVPQQTADGARMWWRYRRLEADDWNAWYEGFASQVLWVGTNGQQADDVFVEVGITHGYKGQNIRTAYSAHRSSSGTYVEARFNFSLILDKNYRFTVEPSSLPDRYNAKIWDGSSTYTLGWNGHTAPVVNYSGGPEATCHTSQINRTYVSVNNYRRLSDGSFLQINNGTLVTFPLGASLFWCDQPVTFRYYLNPSNSPNDCA